MNIDIAKESAVEIFNQIDCYADVDLSESDTRSKFIDVVLVGALGWKEHSIVREPHVAEPFGYIDYLLHTSRPAYVVEAKKREFTFNLPSTKKQRSFKIGGVLSEDKRLREAINQCRDYGIAKGTSFCCVTNGVQYIFFRSHSDLGLPFASHHAVIFDGIEDITSNFHLFYTLLSFDSVSEGRHYIALPVAEPLDISSRFKELSAQSHRLRYKNRNRLEPFIRHVVTEVFQDLAADGADFELIEQCYVESHSQGSYEQSLRSLIKNRPALAEGKARPVRVSRRSAGKFDGVLDNSPNGGTKHSEVVMLLGGIGSGKTTFIRRFRKVIARHRIDAECIWLTINFNKYSDAPGALDRWVSEEIMSEAERDYLDLEFGSFAHLKQAYHSEYERLKRGRLAPLYSADPGAFELQFAQELTAYEVDSIQHVTRLLKSAQALSNRRVFLIFDNADQFSARLQNDVFMLANRLATAVGCSLIVSLREESYWKNKDYGALSAFHGVSFYVEAPDLKQVLAKRFRYASEMLKRGGGIISSGGQGVTQEEAVQVFESIRGTLLDDPRFVQFMESLSPGEVRRPLDQLARFLFSGHTNVDSILRGIRTHQSIRIGFHEFVKSISLGDREKFSEDKSDIVNLFALDGSVDASNMNRLAILGYLYSRRRDKGDRGLGYVPFDQLVDVCGGFGILGDTTQAIVQFLNARRLLETDQQLRESVSSQLHIRTTEAFDYYLETLGGEFMYVDLMLPGTLVPQGPHFDMIERMSQQIYAGGTNKLSRIERIELRIDRAKQFAMFMAEEASKHAMFMAESVVHGRVIDFVNNLCVSLDRQAPQIMGNARRVFSSNLKGRV